jgi:hypothetical protein
MIYTSYLSYLHIGLKRILIKCVSNSSEVVTEALPDCELDEFTIRMYQKIQAASLTENIINFESNEQVQPQKRKQEWKDKIYKQIKEYIYYCQNVMDVAEDLKAGYGNGRYIKEKNSIVFARIINFKDAYYAFKYFDLYKWWYVFGKKCWPELTTAASIMLEKPTHNGFQVHVYSRGTYTDTKLRQSLKERNFEMAVLNSLNGTIVKELANNLTDYTQ